MKLNYVQAYADTYKISERIIIETYIHMPRVSISMQISPSLGGLVINQLLLNLLKRPHKIWARHYIAD